MKKSIHRSQSSEQTEAFGENLAPQFLGKKIFLFGDLGVGKTTFLRGLAKGLKIRSKIKSPTFVGEHIHKISKGKELTHLDLYRTEPLLSQGQALEVEKEERLLELFSSNETVVVEWSERLPKKLLPKKRIELRFSELKSGVRKIGIVKKL